ncbi:AMP-binding protein [Streptomyces thinghirensis]|nr:AMP-binding protein [Streptomyces thinghirensis]
MPEAAPVARCLHLVRGGRGAFPRGGGGGVRGPLSVVRGAERAGESSGPVSARPGSGPGCPGRAVPAAQQHLVVVVLAVLKAGGAYVPVDPASPADRLAHILTDSAPAS